MNTLTTFLSLLILNSFAQSRIGVINDADGYTNVREEKNTNSRIITKIYDYQAFDYTTDGSDWYYVKLNHGKSGYIHQSRVREVVGCSCKSWGGGTPKFVIQNKKHQVEVCGYIAESVNKKAFKISEARISNCFTKQMLLEIDATETATLKIENNEIKVTKVERLPLGQNWSFIETPITIFRLNLTADTLRFEKSSGLNPPYISLSESKHLVDGIKEYPPKNALEFEKIMYKLFVSAISGNLDAEKLFRNYKKEFGVTLDGEMAENFSKLRNILDEHQNNTKRR